MSEKHLDDNNDKSEDDEQDASNFIDDNNYLRDKQKPEKADYSRFDDFRERMAAEEEQDRDKRRKEAEVALVEAEVKKKQAEADKIQAETDKVQSEAEKIKDENDIQTKVGNMSYRARATSALTGSVMIVGGCVDLLFDPFQVVGTELLQYGSVLVLIGITGKQKSTKEKK